MISSFLSKLLMARQADFTEEGIEIFDLNFYMQPVLSLVKFQHEIGDEEKLEKLGYWISESIIDHFKKKFAIEENKISSFWIDIFNISGFGKVQVLDMTKEKTILKLDNNNFSRVFL